MVYRFVRCVTGGLFLSRRGTQGALFTTNSRHSQHAGTDLCTAAGSGPAVTVTRFVRVLFHSRSLVLPYSDAAHTHVHMFCHSAVVNAGAQLVQQQRCCASDQSVRHSMRAPGCSAPSCPFTLDPCPLRRESRITVTQHTASLPEWSGCSSHSLCRIAWHPQSVSY